VAQGTLDPDYMPKLSMTQPVVKFGPFPSWSSEEGKHKIVSIDPFGHMPVEAFPEHLEKGFDIRPTIAVTKAHIDLPECKEAIRVGRLAPDGDVMTEDGQSHITKVIQEKNGTCSKLQITQVALNSFEARVSAAPLSYCFLLFILFFLE